MRELRDVAASVITMTDDPLVVASLTKAGWSAHRAVPTDAAAIALARDGYGVWESLLAFLAEFSGLTIRFIRNGREDSAWFDPERAAAWADHTSVRAYEKVLGNKLVPVGYAYHDHLLLLASREGRFFGAYDDFLADLGTSPAELLHRILYGEVVPIEGK